MKRLLLKAAGVAAAGALLKACGGGGGGGSSPPPVGSNSLLAVMQADSELSLFASAVTRANLGDRYGTAGGSMTLFAADNAAMNQLGSRLGFGDGNGLVNGLSSTEWAGILNFSTLPQALSRDTLNGYARDRTTPDTLYSFETWPNARQLIFAVDAGVYTIWDGVGRTSIAITRGDIGASNGVLHVVTAPLLPRGLLTISQMLRASVDSFGSFVAQMDSSVIGELGNAGSSFTVYAPSFVQVPSLTTAGVRHHITPGRLDGDNFSTRTLTPLAGQQLSVRHSTSSTTLQNVGGGLAVAIVDVDFWASNGVIHSTNAVIPL